MKKESIEDFLARGGEIKKVYYAPVEDAEIPNGGMRYTIQEARQAQYEKNKSQRKASVV